MIRKADIILAAVMIVLGLIVSYAFTTGNIAGSTVTISVNGETYASYSLSENQTIDISQNGHINKITIENGTVSMTFSDCANQDCVRHRSISGTSETIVCLPNKVVAEIQGADPAFDAVSR